jgi:hypothetical protein
MVSIISKIPVNLIGYSLIKEEKKHKNLQLYRKQKALALK